MNIRTGAAAGLAAASLLLPACSSTDPAAPPAASSTATPSGTVNGGLLPPVSAYVEAVNAKDLDGLTRAFAADAELVDVGRRFHGRDAIRGWAEREVIGGTLTVTAIVEGRTGYQKLLVRFVPGGSNSGGFAAHYAFTVSGTAITRADLTYAS
jgi:hypothetical protein